LCEFRGGVVLVTVSGPLSGGRGERLLDALGRRPWCGAAEVVVDLSPIASIDRETVDVLIDLYVATTLRGGTFVLTGTAAGVRQTLADGGARAMIAASEAPARPTGVSGSATRAPR
jgi:anti-anti-sigma regulatory factor